MKTIYPHNNESFAYLCKFVVSHSEYLVDFFCDNYMDHLITNREPRIVAIEYCMQHGVSHLLEYIFWQDSGVDYDAKQ